jgi:hypothetical protein
MHHCLNCGGALGVARLTCQDCALGYEGRFSLPRLARLPGELHALAEQILLAGGNLKEVALAEGVSYPTLRKRVDVLIEALTSLRAADRTASEKLLDEVEAGRIHPEEATRLMKEMSGGR